MKLKFFFCQFPNPWALRVSGMGGYTSKCEKSQDHCTLMDTVPAYVDEFVRLLRRAGWAVYKASLKLPPRCRICVLNTPNHGILSPRFYAWIPRGLKMKICSINSYIIIIRANFSLFLFFQLYSSSSVSRHGRFLKGIWTFTSTSCM